MESSIIEKMKVPQLRQRLIELGLDSKGLKLQLIKRINDHNDELRKKRLSKKINELTDESESEEEEKTDDDEEDERVNNKAVELDEEEDEEEKDKEEDENFEIISGASAVNNLTKSIVKIISNCTETLKQTKTGRILNNILITKLVYGNSRFMKIRMNGNQKVLALVAV